MKQMVEHGFTFHIVNIKRGFLMIYFYSGTKFTFHIVNIKRY
ncbi:TPA: hypothetical protein ACSRER_001202 [Clostridioides difficile]|nr:hypothetical protein [Clostridioides difficile]SJU96795.1 Uncharacterised protein [Clostridioides difficile]SJV34189.1 Uncharacterised protein [Clostridioides difficile]SJV40210.1 Uncharacterised protein [Clostridioides difficile]VHO74618.1 Uncharacterised protein [Clostridioides difficile]VHX57268.1 Uncharacterised protein [Clostridioides difficile]